MLNVPASLGEFLDRLTILGIRASAVRGGTRADYDALHNYLAAPAALEALFEAVGNNVVCSMFQSLQAINIELWDAEIEIRQWPKVGELARRCLSGDGALQQEFERWRESLGRYLQASERIRTLNEQRSEAKRRINKEMDVESTSEIKRYPAPEPQEKTDESAESSPA